MPLNPYRFQLLAPSDTQESSGYPPIASRHDLYHSYLSSMQKLRGAVYLADQAISDTQLDCDGRHKLADDQKCWHFLLIDPHEDVIACARYLVHRTDVSFYDLLLSHAAASNDPVWGPRVKAAVEADLHLLRQRGEVYVEIGGWAIAPEYRNTRAALDTLLGSYAWGRMIGGCISSCTATQRNNSSSILHRIGGVRLVVEDQEIPPYFDPQYGCMMEILRFDSHVLDQKYAKAVTEMRSKLMGSIILKASVELFNELEFQKSLIALGSVLSWNTNTFAAFQKLESPKLKPNL